jgi:hypothetical protein
MAFSEPSCLDLAAVWDQARCLLHSPYSSQPFPPLPCPGILVATPKHCFSAKDWALASHPSMLGPGQTAPTSSGDPMQGPRPLVGTWCKKNEMAQFSGHLNSRLVRSVTQCDQSMPVSPNEWGGQGGWVKAAMLVIPPYSLTYAFWANRGLWGRGAILKTKWGREKGLFPTCQSKSH